MAMVLRDGVVAERGGILRPGLPARRRPGRPGQAAGAVLARPRGGGGAGARAWPSGAVVADDGSVLTLWVDTLCIHGDSPGAVAMATAVRRTMADAGIDVVAPARA